jgi:hypothetical protein
MKHISRDRLKQAMHYDPETGHFTRLISPREFMVGKRAGSIKPAPNGRQYLTVFIDGKAYLAHILAVFYVTGVWPATDVDHENRDGTDNRWNNLRVATRAQNKANSICRKDNACGFKGVSFKQGRWRPRIQVGDKRFYLGSFETPEEANAAYEAAAKKYFGEFARAA